MKYVKAIYEKGQPITMVEKEEATELVSKGTHIVVSRQEGEVNSKHHEVIPCLGTAEWVNDANGNKVKLNVEQNRKFESSKVYPNSTKMGAGASQIGTVRRKGKYNYPSKEETVVETYLTKTGIAKLDKCSTSEEENAVLEKYSKNRHHAI